MAASLARRLVATLTAALPLEGPGRPAPTPGRIEACRSSTHRRQFARTALRPCARTTHTSEHPPNAKAWVAAGSAGADGPFGCRAAPLALAEHAGALPAHLLPLVPHFGHVHASPSCAVFDGGTPRLQQALLIFRPHGSGSGRGPRHTGSHMGSAAPPPTRAG